ncbi:MAG: hypothetical protein GF320_11370 [Armatimonadia bacterium]|nr:hypothetical protein [Armatimonadia bacterium]
MGEDEIIRVEGEVEDPEVTDPEGADDDLDVGGSGGELARRMTDEQKAFWVQGYARWETTKELKRRWRQLWPDERVPTDAALRRYRPTGTLLQAQDGSIRDDQWARLYRRENEYFIATLQHLKFADKRMRLRELLLRAQEISALLDEPFEAPEELLERTGVSAEYLREMKQDIGVKMHDGYHQISLPSRAALRKELLEIFAQIDKMTDGALLAHRGRVDQTGEVVVEVETGASEGEKLEAIKRALIARGIETGNPALMPAEEDLPGGLDDYDPAPNEDPESTHSREGPGDSEAEE